MSIGTTHFLPRLRGRSGEAGEGESQSGPLRLAALDTSPVNGGGK